MSLSRSVAVVALCLMSIASNWQVFETSKMNVPINQVDKLVHDLAEHSLPAQQYVVELFRTHDVVLLAEDHAIKQNLQFVHSLIPLLYKAGVYNLGMEFGASEDQAQLDALVTADRYDEDLARRLMFNYNVGWAFVEYTDVYRKAWELNHSLSKDARKFRILNLSYRYDWTGYEGEKTPAAMSKVFHKGNTEEYRARLIQRKILNQREKILVLTGTVHAFTRYKLAEFDYLGPGFYRLEGRHVGNLLYQWAPAHVLTIILHQPFYGRVGQPGGPVLPAGGVLDQALAAFAHRNIGFALSGSPLGDLADNSYYATGHANFRLGDFADGYVYLAPLSELQGCEIDEKFLTNENWNEAHRQYPTREWHKRPRSREEYLQEIRDYVNLKKRYAGLPSVGGQGT